MDPSGVHGYCVCTLKKNPKTKTQKFHVIHFGDHPVNGISSVKCKSLPYHNTAVMHMQGLIIKFHACETN